MHIVLTGLQLDNLVNDLEEWGLVDPESDLGVRTDYQPASGGSACLGVVTRGPRALNVAVVVTHLLAIVLADTDDLDGVTGMLGELSGAVATAPMGGNTIVYFPGITA